MSRASKSGIGLQIEQKMEARYDQENELGTPHAVCCWIKNITSDASMSSLDGKDWKPFNAALKNGIVLGNLVNALLEQEGKPKVKVQMNVKSNFVEMTNIENFNKGAETYGLKKECLFQSTDLSDGKKALFLNVINCLHSLGMLANSKGYPISYEGKQEKFQDYE